MNNVQGTPINQNETKNILYDINVFDRKSWPSPREIIKIEKLMAAFGLEVSQGVASGECDSEHARLRHRERVYNCATGTCTSRLQVLCTCMIPGPVSTVVDLPVPGVLVLNIP